jgi:hypothetical protein
MPRKVTKSLRRDIAPDRKYESVLVHKLINKTMLAGKKQTAEKIVYEAMEIAAKKLKHDDALKMLEEALGNVKPNLEVKSRRIGGATTKFHTKSKATDKLIKPLCGSLKLSVVDVVEWANQALKLWLLKLSMPSTRPETQLRNAKMCTKWLKPTVLSPILQSSRIFAWKV